MAEPALLPFVDAWAVDVEAPAGVVWEVLIASVPARSPGLLLRVWAWVWGAEPAGSNGLASHELGAERPGFEVCEVVRPWAYAARGRHRFARYQLAFRIEQRGPAQSRLIAETYASFPGPAGRVYQGLVIHARAHAVVMWAMVRLVRRRAERAARRQDLTISR